MSWDDWSEQEQREREEVEFAQQLHDECIADEPSPFCPECEYLPHKCNCMVYGRKLFPTEREPYDWQTRMKPLNGEDHIEIMVWKDWCSDKGKQWRLDNCIQYETVHIKDDVLPCGLVVPHYEVREIIKDE